LWTVYGERSNDFSKLGRRRVQTGDYVLRNTCSRKVNYLITRTSDQYRRQGGQVETEPWSSPMGKKRRTLQRGVATDGRLQLTGFHSQYGSKTNPRSHTVSKERESQTTPGSWHARLAADAGSPHHGEPNRNGLANVNTRGTRSLWSDLCPPRRYLAIPNTVRNRGSPWQQVTSSRYLR
jgi:hypothetical protein